MTAIHQHMLSHSTSTTPWGCDGRRQPGGCKGRQSDGSGTEGRARYRCEQCDFDLCPECVTAYSTGQAAEAVPPPAYSPYDAGGAVLTPPAPPPAYTPPLAGQGYGKSLATTFTPASAVPIALQPPNAAAAAAPPPRSESLPGIQPGALVIIGRHQPVDGDANWSAPMNPLVGKTAQVVRLSGVDSKGCSGVRVAIDGTDTGFFFRMRDLRLEPPQLPQEFGMPAAGARYGPVGVGTFVVIGRHRPIEGQTNWTSAMEPFVGRLARVNRLSGIDNRGCPGVRVDVDGRDTGFFFRLRDMTLASPLAAEVPQDGGMEIPFYGPLRAGSVVIVARHRSFRGSDNWVKDMARYVGCRVAVTRLTGLDNQGCPCARVELDGVELKYAFRIRDLALVAP